MALTLLGTIREILGAGTIFGFNPLGLEDPKTMLVFVLPPGAFLVLAYLIALINQKK